jgi:chromosome segregation ATPase
MMFVWLNKSAAFLLQAAAVITENEQLRVLNLQGVRSSMEAGAVPGTGMRLDPNAPLNSEVLADLQEQLDVLRGENNLLIEQRSVLLSELENHQAELERKAEEMAQQAQQLFAAVSDVQALSKRVEQATQDRDAAAAQALSYSDILGKAEVDQEALTEQVAGLTQRCREAEGLLQEYKRQLRSLSSQGEVESVASTKRVQDAENRVRELHGAVHAKTQEIDRLNEILRKLRAEFQSTRQDAQGMIDVMVGLERQLQEYAKREAEVDQRDRLSREREAETVTFREQVRTDACDLIFPRCVFGLRRARPGGLI